MFRYAKAHRRILGHARRTGAATLFSLLHTHEKRLRPQGRVLAPALTLAAVLLAAFIFPIDMAKAEQPNVVVLGIDGMDPKLLQKFVDAGRMPNFKRMMETGAFEPLQTSIPPQSPVAWSNFITGLDPGGHGIFDFLHQDRSDYIPVFSSALVASPDKSITIGKWVIPLSKGKVQLLRKGDAFWQSLDEADVPYLVFRIPANFPPVESKGVSVAGMGTPDILGSYGTFSFYTDDPTLMSQNVSGGEIYPVRNRNQSITTAFYGPENSMRVDGAKMQRPFTVYLDPENGTARFDIGNESLILAEGEWSDWIRIEFDVMGPLMKISGITRFYLKSIAPYFQLYATPIQIDPSNPALPLSSDGRYYRRLAEKIGYFYTQGMPEDTKALEWGVLSDAEFIQQSESVFQERLRMLDTILDEYESGFLFFYFSSIDQTCHMMWRNMDPAHPAHTAENARYGGRIENLYARMDSVLGEVQSRIPDDATLIVMSDHGFAPYYQKFNLNTWLYENGFLELRRPEDIGKQPLYANVFWRRTRAFGLGINGLYVNLRNREAKGVVKPGPEYEELLGDITEKLLAYRDPVTGDAPVRRVYRASEVYHGDEANNAPDLIIGYDAGYRGSDNSAIGTLAPTVLSDNMDKWSGDHCMAYEVVPGILVSNRPITLNDPKLLDLTASILKLYDRDTSALPGRDVFGHVRTSR